MKDTKQIRFNFLINKEIKDCVPYLAHHHDMTIKGFLEYFFTKYLIVDAKATKDEYLINKVNEKLGSGQ
jgi:hypothetical protein